MATARSSPIRLTWIVVVLLATSGCATVALMPEPLDVEAKRFSPSPEKANIYITRSSGAAPGVLFQVHLDGKLAGSLAPDTYLLVDVEPGKHQIAVLTQESQDAMTITASRGENYFVDLVPKFGWQYARAALKELTQAEGKKAVQNAKRAEGLSLRP